MKRKSSSNDGTISGVGIRAKMLILFTILPVLMLVGLGMFSIFQIDRLGALVASKQEVIVRSMAEDNIRQKGDSVAAELSLFLRQNKDVTREQFQTHPEFQPLAQQPVGETGYTFIFEAPFKQGDANFVYWVHPIKPLIGLEFRSLEERLGDNFDGIDKVLKAVISGGKGTAEGYYNWREKDGEVKSKFMTISRVGTTPYIVVATTYIDEFTLPMQQLAGESQSIIDDTTKILIAAILIAVLVLATIITIFGNRLSRLIRELSKSTQLLTKGKFNITIPGQDRKDELGNLSLSAELLRRSIKIMIGRLTNKT